MMVTRDDEKKKCPRTFDDAELQSHAERANLTGPQASVAGVVPTFKLKILKGFSMVSERHAYHILSHAAAWYNHRRYHPARGNLPPVRAEGDPPMVDSKKAKIVCDSELGGYPKSYRAAARASPRLIPDDLRCGDVFVPRDKSPAETNLAKLSYNEADNYWPIPTKRA